MALESIVATTAEPVLRCNLTLRAVEDGAATAAGTTGGLASILSKRLSDLRPLVWSDR